MMKSHLRRLFHLVVLLSPCWCQAQFFQRTFGWGPFNTAPSCAYRSDGYYGLSGSFSSNGSSQTDFVLIQIDTNGTFQWSKCYGSAGIDNVTRLATLPDSGYVLAGFTNGFSSNNDYDGYVVRTDPFGDTLWTRTFGTSEWDFVNDLKLLSDGNYLLAGSSESSSFGNTAGWLQTITPNGLPVFSRLITDADHRYEFTGVDQANDSILYVCGSMTAITGNIHRPILLQLKYPSLDSSWMFVGDTSWGDAEFSGVSVTRGLQPVACGHSILNGRSDKDILLCKMDTAGNPVWTRIITSTFNEYLTRVITQGDSIVCSGTTDQYGGGGQDFYVIRFRPNGTFLRGRTFGDSESDVAYDVVNSRGNRITAFGTTRSYGPGIVSMMIVACDDSMNLTPPMVVGTEDSKDEASELQLFPNPSEGLIHLIADGMNIHGLTATLTDFSGREIWKMMMTDAEIDLRNEPNGIYLLKLYKEDTIRTFRLVIAR